METTRQQAWVMGLVLLCLLGLFGWRFRELMRERDLLARGKVVHWQFRLVEPVDMSGYACVMTFRGVRLRVTYALCEREGLSEVELGDIVTIKGAWRVSDYGGVIEVTEVAIDRARLTPLTYWWWRRRIELLRQRLLMIYQRGLSEPGASLVAGVVIGEQSVLPSSFKGALQATGTSHIVAASGFNVAVIVGVGLALMSRWGRIRQTLVGGLLIWGYVLLCGASPPVVRAGLMAAVMLLGTFLGRAYWSGWALLLVGLGMVVWQPWLFMSVSFQLSMAATVGVIWGSGGSWIAGLFDRWILLRLKLRKDAVAKSPYYQIARVVNETWLITLAAMIMTAPIVLMTFGQVSWWGLVVNPLVLWLIPPLMYLGLLFGALGIVWFPVVTVLRWVVEPLTTIVITIIETAAQLPVHPLSLSINWVVAFGWWCFWLGWWGMRRKVWEV